MNCGVRVLLDRLDVCVNQNNNIFFLLTYMRHGTVDKADLV